MPVNNVLEYALNHQANARAILSGGFGLPRDDLDDLGQDVLLRIARADPRGIDDAKFYWLKVIKSVAMGWHRRRYRDPVHVRFDDAAWMLEDSRQDPTAAIGTREELAVVLSEATRHQRAAIVALLDGSRSLTGAERTNLCRLRQRLRAGAAA